MKKGFTLDEALTKKGFTLVEVLVALLILSVAMVALTSSWSGSLFAYRKSEKVQLINSLLKSKISELEIKYGTLSYTDIPKSEEGDFGDDLKELKWKAETQDLEFPDLSSILVAGGKNDEMFISTIKKLTEHISKNIKEFRVTIIWAQGKSTLEFSATTYLVNFQGGLPSLGGG